MIVTFKLKIPPAESIREELHSLIDIRKAHWRNYYALKNSPLQGKAAKIAKDAALATEWKLDLNFPHWRK